MQDETKSTRCKLSLSWASIITGTQKKSKEQFILLNASAVDQVQWEKKLLLFNYKKFSKHQINYEFPNM